MYKLSLKECQIYALLLGCIFVFITSCKKEGCTDVEALNYNPKAKKENSSCLYVYKKVQDSPFLPVYGVESASLIHIIHKDSVETNKMGTYTYKNYNFYGVFTSTSGQSYMSAGDLKLTYKHDPGGDLYLNLGQSVNKIYSAYNALDFKYMQSLNTNIKWIGNGDQWPSFSLTITPQYPDFPDVSIMNPKLDEPYTLTINGLSTTDSVLYEIYGQKDKISTIKSGVEPFVTFSKEEIKRLGKGTTLVKIIALNYEQQIIAGKTYNVIYGRDYKKETEVLK